MNPLVEFLLCGVAVLVCPTFILRTMRAWLFERRCLNAMTFDHSGFQRAVALIQYAGPTIAATGEGIAIPCRAHFGRYVEMLYLSRRNLMREPVTATRVMFNKYRWSMVHSVPGSYPRGALATIADALEIDYEENKEFGVVRMRVECDLLLVRETPNYDLLDSQVKAWAQEKFHKAIGYLMEVRTC